MIRQSITLTRQELYERVWATPATKLAKELGISDVALGKICRKLNVPKPYPGYWQQLQAGRRIVKAPLPKVGQGVPAQTTVWPRDAVPRDPRTSELMEAEKAPENCITVEETLHNAHPLIRQTRNAMKVNKGALSHERSAHSKAHVDINVSKPLLNRALRILDALFKTLEARGFSVEVSNDEGAQVSRAVIGEEKVRFFIWEKDNRSERVFTKEELAMPSYQRPERWIFTPSGKLTFTIDEHWDDSSKKNWRDKNDRPLETQLNDILIGIFAASAGVRARRLRWEEWERERQEALLRRQEIERQRLEEEARVLDLEQQAERWVKSRNLHAFLSAYKDVLIQQGRTDHNDPESEWLRWATKYADNLDPLKNGYVERGHTDLNPTD